MIGISRTARSVLAVGPAVFAVLFLVRSVRPTVDTTLLPIGLALAVLTVALLTGRRWAALAYLSCPVAVFATPAGREFSFHLSAIDSTGWRWFAVASLLGLGTAIGLVALVLLDRPPSWRTGGAAVVGGLALGLLMIVGIQAIEPHPAFGGDLSDEEIAALPVIELVNYGYLADGAITIPADGVFLARLENPSDLPHTFTIEAVDVEVWVPAGRWAVVEIDGTELPIGAVAVICTVGDHLDRGMRVDAVVS